MFRRIRLYIKAKRAQGRQTLVPSRIGILPFPFRPVQKPQHQGSRNLAQLQLVGADLVHSLAVTEKEFKGITISRDGKPTGIAFTGQILAQKDGQCSGKIVLGRRYTTRGPGYKNCLTSRHGTSDWRHLWWLRSTAKDKKIGQSRSCPIPANYWRTT